MPTILGGLNSTEIKEVIKNAPLFTTQAANPINKQLIQQIVNHNILQKSGNLFALSLNGIEKRVYEVIV